MSYHGAILPNRGIESLLSLVAYESDYAALILGNGSKAYMDSLQAKVKELSIQDRVMFHKAVPQNEIWKYIGAVDVGMILAPATCKNHLYSLPNKFFENIQSETPIICPNYPAMSDLTNKYEFGYTCDPTDVRSIDSAVKHVFNNKFLYNKCKYNAKIAKEELCWEKEKIILEKAYAKLILN